MKTISSTIIYENPLPQLRARHAFFPCSAELADGTLASVFAIGEAFESVDSKSCISFSKDGGKTWSEPQVMFDKSGYNCPITDYCKIATLPNGNLLAFGYGYIRENEDLPIGNPETGGLLDDFVFYSISKDGGNTWSELTEVDCAWGRHVEASAPITVLADGTWITPITGFPKWNGEMTGKMCGRALVSKDNGKTWNDDAVCMDFDPNPVTCYEQRMCQLESGTIVCIGWNENTATGERLPNHFTYSEDGGKTWSEPKSTGIMGQASSVCAIGGEKLLALHALRRDTDEPGIYGFVVDFSDKEWKTEEKKLLWQPSTPLIKNAKMAEIFSFLKFGQPGAIRLSDGNLLMTHWCAEDGQYKTVATKIEL
ncbi:MAG: exo-alpha-sialidase [Clostridia bacterium]|nr:exo-alpha-sialidase [Clostridia bacterium]